MRNYLFILAASFGALFLFGCANPVSPDSSPSPEATFTVLFDKNDAEAIGTMTSQTITSGHSANLQTNAYTKAGSSFAGWAISANGIVEYGDGASYTMGSADVTLFAKWSSSPTYTVSFNANGGTGVMPDQPIVSGTNSYLTTNTFTRDGWSFIGWSNDPNGSVLYSDNASFTMGSESITLFAKWEANIYHIYYLYGEKNQAVSYGSTVDLLPNTYTQAAYSFIGWSTISNGSVEYSDGASITMGSSDIYLYAIWKPNELSFNSNGGTGSMPPILPFYESYYSLYLPANTFTRCGFAFQGWSTTPDGDVEYIDQQQYSHGTPDNITLYAIWTPTLYTLHFMLGDRAENFSELGTQTTYYGDTITLLYQSVGYDSGVVIGWSSTPNGSILWDAGGSYTIPESSAGSSDIYLYSVLDKYKISFSSNGWGGSMPDQIINRGGWAVLNTCLFGRSGYSFAGWATTPTGAVAYSNNQYYGPMGNGSITLYAVWTPN